jgi:hypothetical protein
MSSSVVPFGSDHDRQVLNLGAIGDGELRRGQAAVAIVDEQLFLAIQLQDNPRQGPVAAKAVGLDQRRQGRDVGLVAFILDARVEIQAGP